MCRGESVKRWIFFFCAVSLCFFFRGGAKGRSHCDGMGMHVGQALIGNFSHTRDFFLFAF